MSEHLDNAMEYLGKAVDGLELLRAPADQVESLAVLLGQAMLALEAARRTTPEEKYIYVCPGDDMAEHYVALVERIQNTPHGKCLPLSHNEMMMLSDIKRWPE